MNLYNQISITDNTIKFKDFKPWEEIISVSDWIYEKLLKLDPATDEYRNLITNIIMLWK